MGYLLSEEEGVPANLGVEVRRESFYLRGREESGFFVYPPLDENGDTVHARGGTVEIMLDDIPAIRKALDAIEAYRGGN